MVRQWLFIWPLLFVLHYAEAQSCFARVQLDRTRVYVQQPFKVTITVLTATWYTAPIEFDNLQVPNAFVLPFDRTMPGMYDHNGEQYAGIQFYYIVFPYKAGEFTIPAITVHATTPPKGSSESRRITLKTPVRHFTVKSVPDNVEGDWLVARSVTLHERWNKSLTDLEVGDVIERTVTVRAAGTLPQFIPPLAEKKLDFANVYTEEPELKDTRNDYDANGELTQSFIYLLEKEGEFVIPSMKVQWWNPNAGKMNARNLPQHTLHVRPNPNLGMVATIRDSLNVAQQAVPVATAKKEPLMILGMHWYWFAAYVLAALIILNILSRLMIKLIRSLRKKYLHYRSSEAYWFRRLMRSPASLPVFWQRLYQWWDRADQKGKTTDILETATEFADKDWEKLLGKVNEQLYCSGSDSIMSKADFVMKRRLRSFRKWLYQKGEEGQSRISEGQREWKGENF